MLGDDRGDVFVGGGGLCNGPEEGGGEEDEDGDVSLDQQKATSDIQAMVATGVDAIVVFPDTGEAMLPALRSAYEAGVVTVPYRVRDELW